MRTDAEHCEDAVLRAFLERQLAEGMALAGASEILDLVPVAGRPPFRYVATFRCVGLVVGRHRRIVEHDRFRVGIAFPPDYLRRVVAWEVLALLAPPSVWHPNVALAAPFICAGRLAPGTGLADLLYQTWEILTYRRVTMREDDALNAPACVWARANQHRFPTDPRPLKRREGALHVEMLGGGPP